MFKGKRFKQQSKLNASTTENQLSLACDDARQGNSLRKRLKDVPANRSVCAKMKQIERRPRYSLQHRNNPEEGTTGSRQKQKGGEQGRPQMQFKIKMSHNLNNGFALKIKQKCVSTVTPVMRIIIIDWLMQVVVELSLRREAFHTAIHYLDQLLARTSITKKELQAYGLCCLMIAQKLESQKILTPAQASQLLNCQVLDRELIAIEECIMKTLEFKLHPVTLWTEMRILLKAFQSYFRDKISEKWDFYRCRALWIIEGVCLQKSYFGKTALQRQLCLSLLYLMVCEYDQCLMRYFSAFCRSITGGELWQEMAAEARYLGEWARRECPCVAAYSLDHYHGELKAMAASGVRG